MSVASDQCGISEESGGKDFYPQDGRLSKGVAGSAVDADVTRKNESILDGGAHGVDYLRVGFGACQGAFVSVG